MRDCSEIDFLIIMGGPQSPDTTLDECPYFDAKKEILLIKNVIQTNKLVLGDCGNDLKVAEGLPYVQKLDELGNYDFSQMNSYLFKFLEYMQKS